MVNSLIKGFTTIFYRNIHIMKKHNWSLDELLMLPPLELSIFKNMVLQDAKTKEGKRR